MTEQSVPSNPAPLWNGWALGMFFGLVALSGVFFGWKQTIHLDRRWANLASEFQATCRDEQMLAMVIDDLINGENGNNELRAAFRQLEPRTYPAAPVPVYGIEERQPEADTDMRIFSDFIVLPAYTCETQPTPHAPNVFSSS